MNKRTIIIFIVVAGLLAGGLFWYFSKINSATPNQISIFPGGSTSTGTGHTATPGTGSTNGENGSFVPSAGSVPPRLYQLHGAPVAGAGFALTKDKKGQVINTSVRYIERGLGNIFETNLATYKESRIVNETRPHLSEALWGNNGNSVVVRFVDDVTSGVIISHIVNIKAPSLSNSTSTLDTPSGFLPTEEVYLPDSVPFMSMAEDNSDSLFYLNGKNGLVTTSTNAAASNIFSSVFTEWLPQYPNQKLVTLTTRPSADVPGHMFFVDTKTKAVTKVLGNINGLTTLTNHDGKLVLYSETKDNAPQLSLYDVTKKISIPLYLRALPEKCVWGIKNPTLAYCAVPQTVPQGTYPDQWYQGVVSFSDNIWVIDSTTYDSHKILTPSDNKVSQLDITNLSISPDDSYLIFTNKIDFTPWLYSITAPSPLGGTSISSSQTTTTTGVATSSSAAVPPSVVTSDMQKLK